MTDFEKEFVVKIIPQCVSELKLDESIMEKFSQNNLEPTPENKCFVKCLFVKLHVMDNDGHLTTDNLAEKLGNDQKQVAVYEECASKSDAVKPDPCDTAFGIFQCLKEKTG